MSNYAIRIDHVTKRFQLRRNQPHSLKESLVFRRRRRRHVSTPFVALDDVTIDVEEGSVFGLVGANGAGKSTLLKCLARIYHPDEGEVTVHGRMSSLLELGTGFHPDLTGRENVFLNGSILGLPRREIQQRFDEIVEFAELGRFIDSPIKTYSSGMVVRLGFSVATCVAPEILLVDEVLAVGDARFRRRSRQRMETLLTSGCTIVLVGHDLGTMKSFCDSAASLVEGRVRKLGDAAEVVDDYADMMTESDPTRARTASRRLIESAEVVAADGSEIGEIDETTPVVVRLRLAGGRPPGTTVGLALRSADGTMIWFVDSQDALDDVGPDEPVALDVHLDPMPLMPGHYGLTVSVRDRRSQRVYDWSNPLRVVVAGDVRAGYLQPRARWNTAPGDGADASPASSDELDPASIRR